MKEVWAYYIERVLSPLYATITIAAPVVRELDGGRFQTYALNLKKHSVLEIPSRNTEHSWLRNIVPAAKLVTALYKLISQSDVVWVFMPTWRALLAAFLCQRLAIPYVAYSGISWASVEDHPLKARVKQWVEMYIVRGAQFALVRDMEIVKRDTTLSKSVIRAASAIKLSRDDISYRQPRSLQAGMHLLFVGGLMPRKGLDFLVEATSILDDMGFSNVRLTIVGSGQETYVTSLREQVDSLGITDLVEFIGYVPNGPELYTLYQQADVFVLPTLNEGYPRVLDEAMTFGLAVVTTPVGAISEVVLDGWNGLLVPPRSAQGLVDALLRLHKNPELVAKLVQNGYRTVESALLQTPEDQVQELLIQCGLATRNEDVSKSQETRG